MQAMQNIEVLNAYEVEKVVTACYLPFEEFNLLCSVNLMSNFSNNVSTLTDESHLKTLNFSAFFISDIIQLPLNLLNISISLLYTILVLARRTFRNNKLIGTFTTFDYENDIMIRDSLTLYFYSAYLEFNKDKSKFYDIMERKLPHYQKIITND